MNLAWIIGVAAFLGIIWPLIQMGRNLDKEDDPKTTERKEQLGQWLSGRGNRTLESRMQTTSETFLYLFDRIFKGKGSPLEQSIWMGFFLSPAFLLLADGLNIIDFLGSSGAGLIGSLEIPAVKQVVALSLRCEFTPDDRIQQRSRE